MLLIILLQTSSEGRHSVRISGLSTIDFRAGFSRKHTLDFKMTSSRPVQGELVWRHLCLDHTCSCQIYEVTILAIYLSIQNVFWLTLITSVSLYTHRNTYFYPVEHHRTLFSCSCGPPRAPEHHWQCNEDAAYSLLSWTTPIWHLEHHRVCSTQRGLLPARHRLWPWRLCFPKSIQCVLLQHCTRSDVRSDKSEFSLSFTVWILVSLVLLFPPFFFFLPFFI